MKIGITGGIGSGKSTVCRVFETLGIPVFYADQVAKEIMVSDPVLVAGMIETFGPESYSSPSVLNNKYIGAIVFQDELELKKLNDLVHPAVFRAFEAWSERQNPSAPYLLKEAALLFESGSHLLCDLSIVVSAPLNSRLDWVAKRDSLTKEQILARMDKQWPEEAKIKMADYVIYNDESASLILQVMNLHEQFIARKHA